MEKRSIKHLREQVTTEIQEQTAKLRKMYAETTTHSRALLILTKEEMVPYKHMRNLVELPLGLAHTLVAMGYIEHFGEQKLVVKLKNGVYFPRLEIIWKNRKNNSQQDANSLYPKQSYHLPDRNFPYVRL